MLLRVALGNGCTSIRGAVVYQQQFPRIVCLAEDALERFLQEALCIKEDDNDRDQRHSAHVIAAFHG